MIAGVKQNMLIVANYIGLGAFLRTPTFPPGPVFDMQFYLNMLRLEIYFSIT